jgi:hypothetical protein
MKRKTRRPANPNKWMRPKSFTVDEKSLERLATIAKVREIENNDSLVLRQIIEEAYHGLPEAARAG